MTPRHIAILLMIVVMVVWGSTFVVTKHAIAEIPPLTLSFIRVSIGALVLLPFALYRQRRCEPGRPLPWRAMLLLSFIGVATYYAVFNLALSYTSASQGALVQSCIPAMTALAAIVLLRERASRIRLAGVALSIIGILIVFSGAAGGGMKSGLLGNVLMFISVVSWGVYTALAKRLADYDSVVVTACIIGGGALMLAPLALLEIGQVRFMAISLDAWLGVLYLGAVASGAAYLVYNYSLRYMDAGQAGVFANLIPLVGVVSGIVVLHEPLSLRAVTGGCVVLLGVWITGAEKSAAVGSPAQSDKARQH